MQGLVRLAVTMRFYDLDKGLAGSGFRVQGFGGGFAEILRLRSQLFWHPLSHIRRFSPLRMTKQGDAQKSYSSHQSLEAPNP